ncbi:ShlB/FhaC/HecB family hemolysin secretion/activation protein [Gammaproteobacteria bacterium]
MRMIERFLRQAPLGWVFMALMHSAMADLPAESSVRGPERLSPPRFAPESRSRVPHSDATTPAAALLSVRAQVFLKALDLVGSTVFTWADIEPIVRPYLNRSVSAEELQQIRLALTQQYVDKGYINSGVIIPDQEVIDGTVRMQVIEGRLSELQVTGIRRLRADYIKDRLWLGAGKPLNINALQERILLLHEDPLIERINAELSPGLLPGEAVLKADTTESSPYRVRLGFDNRRPPSVGEYMGTLHLETLNLTGLGDGLYGEVSEGRGPADYRLGYSVPLTAQNTRLSLRYDLGHSMVFGAPYQYLDIESKSRNVALALTHPLVKTTIQELALGLSLESRRCRGWLLGDPYGFCGDPEKGHSLVNVARFSQDWTYRTVQQVVAARSTLSAGVGAFGATVHADWPDSQFLAWLGQFQWARRVFNDHEWLFRASAQWANDRLLPQEQFAVGGLDTVRGYLQNQLVRDTGWIASLEYRLPLLRHHPAGDLQMAGFIDGGGAVNRHDQEDSGKDVLVSAGLGLLYQWNQRISAQLYWGHRLRQVSTGENSHGLQDKGVAFSLNINLF